MSKKPKASSSPLPMIEEEVTPEAAIPSSRKASSKSEVLFAAVGRKIVESRKALHMSQSQLARAAETPVSTVFSAETGQHNISLGTLQKIADALKLDMRDLMPGTKPLPATDDGTAMLRLVEGALQATVNEMNRTMVMLQHVVKMVADMQQPGDSKRDTEH